MSDVSIARSLARFINSVSCNTLNESIILRAKNLILDALGCAVGGIEAECTRIAMEMLPSTKGECTVFGSRITATAMDAAFVNATSTNALALDDFLYTFHPGTVNVPTAFAVADQNGLSGEELITAIVAGYEIMGRIYLGGPNIAPKFRATSVYGPFGSAAAAGKLLKLNENLLTNALCYAANFCSGLTQCWLAGTLEGYFHPGMSARDGILAAILAKANASGAEYTLEGDRGFYLAYAGTRDGASKITADLGSKYMIMEASFKGYPVCALQQIPLELIAKLRDQHKIKPKHIKEVVEEVSAWEAKFPGSDYAGPFENVGQTLLSAQFCAAAALLSRPVSSFDFYPKNFDDPEIAELAKRIKVVGVEGRTFPLITLILDDGEAYRIEGDEKMDTLVPSTDKTRSKFMDLTTGLLGEKKARHVIDLVSRLEELKDIRELTKLLIRR